MRKNRDDRLIIWKNGLPSSACYADEAAAGTIDTDVKKIVADAAEFARTRTWNRTPRTLYGRLFENVAATSDMPAPLPTMEEAPSPSGS